LQHLDVSVEHGVFDNYQDQPERHLLHPASLSQLSALTHLTLRGCKGVTPEMLGLIAGRCLLLRELDLAKSENINNACIACICTMPNIQALGLTNCQVRTCC
jgi:hypothetical protein